MRAQLISIALALAALGSALPSPKIEIDSEYGVLVKFISSGGTVTGAMKMEQGTDELIGLMPMDGMVGTVRILIVEKGSQVGPLKCQVFSDDNEGDKLVESGTLSKTEDSGFLGTPIVADYLSCVVAKDE